MGEGGLAEEGVAEEKRRGGRGGVPSGNGAGQGGWGKWDTGGGIRRKTHFLSAFFGGGLIVNGARERGKQSFFPDQKKDLLIKRTAAIFFRPRLIVWLRGVNYRDFGFFPVSIYYFFLGGGEGGGFNAAKNCGVFCDEI